MVEKIQHPVKRTLRMSGLFFREIVGWGLMLWGFTYFRESLQYLRAALVIEGMIATMVGIVVFRGGLQLVKVSVAARAFRVDRQALAVTSLQRIVRLTYSTTMAFFNSIG